MWLQDEEWKWSGIQKLIYPERKELKLAQEEDLEVEEPRKLEEDAKHTELESGVDVEGNEGEDGKLLRDVT